MKQGPTVNDLKEKFESGKANNAKGTARSNDTDADSILAKQSENRKLYQFDGYKAQIKPQTNPEVQMAKKAEPTMDMATLRLIQQIQAQDRALAEQRRRDEAASQALIKQLLNIKN